MVVEWNDPDRTIVRNLFESHSRMRAVLFPLLDLGDGAIWVDFIKTPSSALLSRSPIQFLAGDASSPSAAKLVERIPRMQLTFVPDDEWATLVKSVWGTEVGIQQRVKLSAAELSLEHVRGLLKPLPEGYTLERVHLAALSGTHPSILTHIRMLYESTEAFVEHGVGFCIRHGEETVSMASSFTPFINEFEVEVDTLDQSEYRRKGFGTIVCAALIEYCLENDIIPHWDAANEVSVKLALKLGYVEPDRYVAYYRKKAE